eukprot:GILK01003599.1.p1 GENE.GILK01003599.1~~GILK01003599.1.p1  ORF type:complete len:137 (-),score=32.03 GILK01003599.1:223-594(-)
MSNGNRVIYVGGLEEQVTTAILHAAFLPFGDIKTVEIPLDIKTQKHRGFGFVEFEDEEDVKHAIDNMHDSELYGRTLRVNLSKQMKRVNTMKPVWANDEYYRDQLKEGGLEVDDSMLTAEETS